MLNISRLREFNMKLTELNKKSYSRNVLKDYFNTDFDTARISESKRKYMLDKVSKLINEVHSSSKIHTSEKNPAYLKLLMIKEALVTDGNEFVAARLAAIKAGEKEFTVGGKKYKVTGDISDELEEGFMPDKFEGKLEDGTTYTVEIDQHDEVGYIPKPMIINGKPAHMAEQDVYDAVMDDAREEIAQADIDIPMEGDVDEAHCGTHRKKKNEAHMSMGSIRDELKDLEMDIANTSMMDPSMKMKRMRHADLMMKMKAMRTEGEHNKPEIATYYKPKKNVPDLKTFLKKNRNVVMDPQTGSYTTKAKLKKKEKAGKEADAVISYVANMPNESKQVTEDAQIYTPDQMINIIADTMAESTDINFIAQVCTDVLAGSCKVADDGKNILWDPELNESKQVTESEVEQAQVVLASQDMADKIQAMSEDVAGMRYEDLPALVDQMRDELGVNQAQKFADSSVVVLDKLLKDVGEAKQGMDSAMSGMTGQEPISADSMSPDIEAPAEEEPSDIQDLDPTDNLGRDTRD